MQAESKIAMQDKEGGAGKHLFIKEGEKLEITLNDIRYQLAGNIRNKRIALGLTPEDIETSIGIDRLTLEQYENGCKYISSEVADIFGRLYGGKLYTTYFANIKNIPERAVKYFIVRIPPKSFRPESYPDIIHRPDLSPSKYLLLSYKEDGNWNRYVQVFLKEMNEREDLKRALEELNLRIKTGEDICLICYEKDSSQCHRSLEAMHLMQRGISWQEL